VQDKELTMEKALVELSADEFERLVERTIDRRLEVWFTQLVDAWTGLEEEDEAELEAEFAASLRHALEQARAGMGVDLKTFRGQIGQ
jgi:hypothetical protein